MKKYNTAIIQVTGISDLNIIIETIKSFKKEGLEKTKEEFVNGNVFGFNITSSRTRIFSIIKNTFLDEPDKPANQFFINTTANSIPSNSFKRQVIYLEFFRQNDLLADITMHLVYEKYHENRRLIDTKEILNFLLDFGEGTKITEWSDSTIKNISSKYINFMKKIGLFEKESRTKSMIAFPYPDEKLITYLVYLLKATDLSDNEIYNSDLFKALMLTEDQKVELLKKGSLKGYYDFNFTGAKNATFELNYSREEIIDELFKK